MQTFAWRLMNEKKWGKKRGKNIHSYLFPFLIFLPCDSLKSPLKRHEPNSETLATIFGQHDRGTSVLVSDSTYHFIIFQSIRLEHACSNLYPNIIIPALSLCRYQRYERNPRVWSTPQIFHIALISIFSLLIGT